MSELFPRQQTKPNSAVAYFAIGTLATEAVVGAAVVTKFAVENDMPNVVAAVGLTTIAMVFSGVGLEAFSRGAVKLKEPNKRTALDDEARFQAGIGILGIGTGVLARNVVHHSKTPQQSEHAQGVEYFGFGVGGLCLAAAFGLKIASAIKKRR